MAKIEGRGNGALAYERQISNEISWVSWIFRAENSLYMYMRCFGWCDNLKEPHKLKKTSMDFFRGIFCRKPGKNQGIKTCIVNMGEVSETFDQVVKDFSWDFMVSRWVKMDTKSSKVNIFQVARAIKRPPWGSQYDVRKRVENDEQVHFCMFDICLQFVETLTRKNPATRHQVIFLGWYFWNCSPLHVAQTSFRQYVTKFFGNARDLYGDSVEFFFGEKKTGQNLRIWVPKQTTPTRRSV